MASLGSCQKQGDHLTLPFLPQKASFRDQTTQHVWDSSSLSTYLRCPRRYFYTYVCNLRPRTESYDLTFGSLFHIAMEEYHLERMSRGHNEAQVLGLQALLKAAWTPAPLGAEGPAGGYWKSDSNNKNLWNCIRAFIWHTEHFATEPDFNTTVLNKKLYAVELPFTFDLDLSIQGISASYCGHLDRVVDTMGGRWVVDYKTTTKTLSSSYFDTYNPSTQLPGYAVAAQIVFHEPVQGVIIDAMQIGVDFTRCGRSHIRLGEERANEWMENAREWVEDAMVTSLRAKLVPTDSLADFASKNAHFWKMNTESCFICPYKEVCRSTPSVRGILLEADFVTSIWDPAVRQGAKNAPRDRSLDAIPSRQLLPGEIPPRQPEPGEGDQPQGDPGGEVQGEAQDGLPVL